jgi:hypothetical protein
MRNLILGFVVFLAACNGSTTNVPYTDPQVTAKLDSLTEALAAATHIQAEQAASLNKLTLIGKVHGVSNELKMQGEFRTEAQATVSFGPCSDMGVLVGFTNPNNNSAADPLTATYQAFKQCTGYYYEAQVGTGNVAIASRIFWDGPNCTGNMYEWEAGGAGYNTQTLENGVVFISPVDGSELAVTAGQTGQPIMIQSAWVAANPSCQSDIETQLLYSVTPNVTSVTGVPMTVGEYQLVAP